MHLLHIAEAVALDGDPLSEASEAEAEFIRSRVAETGMVGASLKPVTRSLCLWARASERLSRSSF